MGSLAEEQNWNSVSDMQDTPLALQVLQAARQPRIQNPKTISRRSIFE